MILKWHPWQNSCVLWGIVSGLHCFRLALSLSDNRDPYFSINIIIRIFMIIRENIECAKFRAQVPYVPPKMKSALRALHNIRA